MTADRRYPPAEIWEGVEAYTPEDYDQYCEARAEAEVEAGYERWLEDGGPHAASIQAEAEMERRREDAMGVVQFEDAMLMAQEDYR